MSHSQPHELLWHVTSRSPSHCIDFTSAFSHPSSSILYQRRHTEEPDPMILQRHCQLRSVWPEGVRADLQSVISDRVCTATSVLSLDTDPPHPPLPPLNANTACRHPARDCVTTQHKCTRARRISHKAHTRTHLASSSIDFEDPQIHRVPRPDGHHTTGRHYPAAGPCACPRPQAAPRTAALRSLC
eukprot:2943560-Rhodomonas_salina.1